MLKIETPLGADKVLVRSFSGREEISRLFNFQIELVSEDGKIDAQDIVGKNVTFAVLQADGSTERYFNGYVIRFGQRPSRERLHRYHAEVVPWLWFLTRSSDCRIFQKKTVPDIVKEVFGLFGFSDFDDSGIQGQHLPWDSCVQYRETAFNFIARLLEQEGIFYFFRHENGKHILVLADRKSVHKPCPYQSKVRMEPARGSGFHSDEDVVSHWEHHYRYRSGKWAQTDYNFETPSTSLLSNSQTVVSLPNNTKYEIFDYPGEYATKGEGSSLTKLRMEEEEVPHDAVQGAGTCRSFTPGGKFTLTHHERRSENKGYVITSISHSASQGGFSADDEGQPAQYSNNFSCIPDKVQFRPARITPKPLVQGTQTAVVVGPKGEEIYTDKYGRVKVQFHWDRLGKYNENSSCWIRVSQPWAGKNWGAVFNPRIGQEVIVDFLEGDPDRPLIVGRVYNAELMPPYTLPANQTQSGFKSRSSKKGGTANFNEIRFEDKKGSEQIFINAEKDMDERVENDSREWVGNDRHLIVKNDQKELVEGDKHLHVKGEQMEKVDKDMSLTVGGDRHEKTNKNYALDAGKEIHFKAGQKVVVEARSRISLKVGGNFVDIGTGGVTIKGTMVRINSGGMAASGSGSSPKSPAKPDTADDGSKGTKM